MFGSTTTGGGSLQPGFNTSSTSFGGMAGSSLFGNTQKPAGGLFGGGAQQTAQPTGSLFGTAPQAPTTGGGMFGGFGSTAAPQATSIFGATQPAVQPSSLFGGGGTNMLPTNSAAPTSLFGNTQRPAGGLFGGGAQQTSQPTGSLFGTTSQAPTTGGGMFGGFGSTAAPQATSIFGATQPAAQPSSLFGGASQATGTMIKFDPLKASDTMLMGGVPKPIQTKHMCISAMKQYEAKSLEELRVEDYLANRKTGSGGMAGSSLFANTQKPAGGLFSGGAQQTAQPTGSLFNTASQAQTGGGVFGGFGSTTTPQATSIFGAKPTAQQPTSFFSGGGTNMLPTNTAAPTSLFSNTQKPAGGLFSGGAQQTAQPANSIFGTTSLAPTAGGGVFGGFGSTTTAPQATSIFGPKPPQQPSIFSGATTTFPPSQPTLPATSSAFPSFGNAPPLFGSAQQTAPAATAGFGSTQMYGAAAAPQMNMGNIQHAIIEAQLNALPYGDSPLLKMSTPLQGSGEKKSSDSSSITRRVSSMTSTSSARAASTPSTKQTPPSSAKVPVAGVSLNTSALNASFTYKPLVSLPYAGFGAPLSLGKSPSVTGRPSNVSANDSTSLRNSSFLSQASREGGEKGSAYRPTSTLKAKAFDVSVLRKQPSRKQSFDVTPKLAETTQGNGTIRAQSKESETRASDESAQLEASRREEPVRQQASAKKSPPKPASGVVDEKKALRPEYYYRPSLDTLRESFHDGVAKIDEGLTIGRLGYGSVFWRGPFEIHDVDSLQDVVHFRAREAVVYPDDSKKPEAGEELNRPAEVSLECIWPISKETRDPIKDSDEIRRLGFRAKLEKTCEHFGGTFKDYNPATGTWTFSVPHF